MSTTIATVEAEETNHGHGASPCTYCWNPESCDCPCTSCIHYRHAFAGSDCKCGCTDAATDAGADYDTVSCCTNDRPDDEDQEMAYADDEERDDQDRGEYWN